jgi:two-component system response regulator AtoC
LAAPSEPGSDADGKRDCDRSEQALAASPVRCDSLSPLKTRTILIVDDEKNTRDGLRQSLEDDFDVYVASDVAGALGFLETETIDLLLTDLRLGADDGMTLIDRALKMPTAPVCIMMTAYGSVDTAVEAMKRGAYDFVTKPVNLDKLEILIRRALRGREVETENVELRQQVERRSGKGLEALIGRSAVMEDVFDTIRQVAPTRATVLIEGESGTGKELVAGALHALSNRRKARFVAVHCAALSPQLLESELFGHERGAFTGATERRIGRFEQADGGTLFLDEIGEIDASTQVKILRVLGERTFERVGGNQSVSADVRLVAATNKHLETLVAEGKFRDDLFYRLNVVRMHMPPLRERRDDIPLLVQAFLKQSCQENEKPVRELTADAMNRLLEYSWPGNVRELRAAVDHGVVLATGPKITLRDLPLALRQWVAGGDPERPLRPAATGGSPASALNIQATKHDLMQRALRATGGNITEAARQLGISRRTLHRKLKLPQPEPLPVS